MNLTPPPAPPAPAEPTVETPNPVDSGPADTPAGGDFVVHDEAVSADAADAAGAADDAGPPSSELEHAVEALEQGEVVDDDDVMNLPAPDASVLASKPVKKGARRPPVYTTLAFKQTVIPILLTLGVCLPIVGLLCFVWSDSMLGILGDEAPFVPITFLIVGIVMLIFAALNIAQVKRQLGSD